MGTLMYLERNGRDIMSKKRDRAQRGARLSCVIAGPFCQATGMYGEGLVLSKMSLDPENGPGDA